MDAGVFGRSSNALGKRKRGRGLGIGGPKLKDDNPFAPPRKRATAGGGGRRLKHTKLLKASKPRADDGSLDGGPTTKRRKVDSHQESIKKPARSNDVNPFLPPGTKQWHGLHMSSLVRRVVPGHAASPTSRKRSSDAGAAKIKPQTKEQLIAATKKEKKPTKPKKQKLRSESHASLASLIGTHPAHVDRNLVDCEKESIASMVPVAYPHAKVRIISDEADVDDAVSSIRSDLEAQGRDAGPGGLNFLGFDTETKPQFRAKAKRNSVALVQLATKGGTAYLFRLCRMRRSSGTGNTHLPPSLRDLLSDPTVIKIGVGVEGDVRDLQRLDPNFDDRGSFLDLGPLVKIRFPKLTRCGLRNLGGTLLNRKLSKNAQMSNWEKSTMTTEMVKYAAADAFVALDLLDVIMGRVNLP